MFPYIFSLLQVKTETNWCFIFAWTWILRLISANGSWKLFLLLPLSITDSQFCQHAVPKCPPPPEEGFGVAAEWD